MIGPGDPSGKLLFLLKYSVRIPVGLFPGWRRTYIPGIICEAFQNSPQITQYLDLHFFRDGGVFKMRQKLFQIFIVHTVQAEE